MNKEEFVSFWSQRYDTKRYDEKTCTGNIGEVTRERILTRISVFQVDYQFGKMLAKPLIDVGLDAIRGGAEVARRWVRHKNSPFSSRSTAR